MRFGRSLIAIVLMAAVGLGMLSGCTTRIGDFTLMSTKNVNISDKYVKVGNFESDDLAWMIIVIPTGFPNFKTAVDNILDENGGELLTNAVLSSYQAWFVLAGQYGYKIKGDVWKRASVGDLRNGTEIFELRTDASGEQKLVSTKDNVTSYTVTTSDDLARQADKVTADN